MAETPKKRIRKRRLTSMSDVRRYLAFMVYEVECDRISPKKSNALTYTLALLQKTIEAGELETRILALEQKNEGAIK